MAFLTRHPKSKYWTACFRGSDGKRKKLSTGVSDKAEARRIAGHWEIEAARQRAIKAPDVSPGGITDTIVRAERLARQGRMDPGTAREVINSLLVASGLQTIEVPTNRMWIESWKAGKRGTVKERSRLKYDQVSRDWLTFLNTRADKSMEILTRTDSVAFRDHLFSSGLSARTVNQTIKLLRGIYGEAVEQGYIGRNPFIGHLRLKEKSENVGRQPFTREEVKKLIATAEGDWKGLLVLAASSGLRLMDAARLKWQNISNGVLSLKTAKRGAVVNIPLHPEFEMWLNTQPVGTGAAPIFPSLATKAGTGKSGLSMAFKRVMGKAEICAGIAREGKGRGRTTSRKSFHSLRHFAASQLAENGVRAEIASKITGHADLVSHANYVSADFDALRRAVDSIQISG